MTTKKEKLYELTRQLKKLDQLIRINRNNHARKALYVKRFRLQGKIIKATMEAKDEGK